MYAIIALEPVHLSQIKSLMSMLQIKHAYVLKQAIHYQIVHNLLQNHDNHC